MKYSSPVHNCSSNLYYTNIIELMSAMVKLGSCNWEEKERVNKQKNTSNERVRKERAQRLFKVVLNQIRPSSS